MNAFQFHLPVQIRFGTGRIQELQSILGEQFKNVLIVTDKGVAEKSRALEAILPQLSDYHVTLFNQVEQNPSYKTLAKGHEVVERDEIQVVIGLGGGSPMDAAKGIAVLATNGGKIEDYIAGEPLEADPLPIICIPTTSGTGSEVTPYAVFTDTEAQEKAALSHPQIFPAVSIIDPELSYTMPKTVILSTGLDVLTHAIEAYFSTQANPLTDIYALEAIRIVLNTLPVAVKREKEALNKMAYASMLAGIAIAHTSTILLHIMAYPLTLFHRLPHGKANSVLLPAFMQFMKAKSTVPERVNFIEDLFKNVNGIETFLEELGVSCKLREYGVETGMLDGYAEQIMKKDDVKITPAKVSKKVIVDIYKSSL
jgi:1,3-propanediol dehydrogenase/alcohol dehydrogenase